MLVNTPISVLTTNMAIIHASYRGCATGQWHFGNNKLHIQRKAIENNYWRGLSVPSIQKTQQRHLLPCKTTFACRVLILWLQVMIITLYLSLCKLGSSPRLFGHWEYRHEAVPLKVLDLIRLQYFDGDTGKVIPIKRDISRISCVKPPLKKCCFTLLKFHFCSILSMFNFCQNLMTWKQSCKKTNDIYLHVLTFPTEFIDVYSKHSS